VQSFRAFYSLICALLDTISDRRWSLLMLSRLGRVTRELRHLGEAGTGRRLCLHVLVLPIGTAREDVQVVVEGRLVLRLDNARLIDVLGSHILLAAAHVRVNRIL